MNYKHKRMIILSISLLLLLFLYLFKNFSNWVRVASLIFGMWVFYFFDHAFKINFNFKHYVSILIILISGILLASFYFIYPNFDKALHLIMPIFGASVIFFILDKQKISFKWKVLITSSIVLSFLVIHEIGEYILDYFWDYKLQGVYLRDITGLEKYHLILPKHDDTMIDLMMGVLGLILYSFSSFLRKRFRVIN